MVVHVCLPNRIYRQSLAVSEDDEGILGAGDGDVHPLPVTDEADVEVIVGLHARHNDDVSLLTLKRVHSADFQPIHFLIAQPLPQKLVFYVFDLRFVRCDDADSQVFSHVEHSFSQIHHDVCLSLVLVRFLQFLFSSIAYINEPAWICHMLE